MTCAKSVMTKTHITRRGFVQAITKVTMITMKITMKTTHAPKVPAKVAGLVTSGTPIDYTGNVLSTTTRPRHLTDVVCLPKMALRFHSIWISFRASRIYLSFPRLHQAHVTRPFWPYELPMLTPYLSISTHTTLLPIMHCSTILRSWLVHHKFSMKLSAHTRKAPSCSIMTTAIHIHHFSDVAFAQVTVNLYLNIKTGPPNACSPCPMASLNFGHLVLKVLLERFGH